MGYEQDALQKEEKHILEAIVVTSQPKYKFLTRFRISAALSPKVNSFQHVHISAYCRSFDTLSGYLVGRKEPTFG